MSTERQKEKKKITMVSVLWQDSFQFKVNLSLWFFNYEFWGHTKYKRKSRQKKISVFSFDNKVSTEGGKQKENYDDVSSKE